MILDREYYKYNHALEVVGLKTLCERRKDLCLNFATKALKNEKFSNWFCPNEHFGMETRSVKTTLKLVNARTCRFEKSPLAYLTRVFNDKLDQLDCEKRIIVDEQLGRTTVYNNTLLA